MQPSLTLQSGLADTPGGLPLLRETVKLRLRAWRHRRETRRWLALLNGSPLLGRLARNWPRLIQKIYRPYLSGAFDCQERLSLLTEHYRVIAARGLGALVEQAARAPVTLASVTGKSGTSYRIDLRAINAMEREGELTLQLASGGQVIYSTAFSFLKAEHRLSIGLGCLQGPQGADGLALVREATRDLHGIRPKNLMVRLARQLGHDIGCQAMVLVGNDNRAVRHSTKKGLVLADYDALWRELGAHPRGNGDFELACEDLPPLQLEDIASKKRSEAKKRHQTVIELSAAIRVGLRLSVPGPDATATIQMAITHHDEELSLA